MQMIYSSYRSPGYQKRRARLEPWYTKKVNEALGDDEQALYRREVLKRELLAMETSQHISLPARILDYGGDKGQFIPILHGTEARAVFEVSDAQPTEGVVRLLSKEECSNFRPDMIMLCHVLEHLADPVEPLETIAEWARRFGSLVYCEIPLDAPARLPRRSDSRVSQMFRKAASRHRFAFTAIDMMSMMLRLLPFSLPSPLYKQSEHLNYWNISSLEALGKRVGLDPIHSFSYKAGESRLIPAGQSLGVFFRVSA